jgi:hypothetical protein
MLSRFLAWFLFLLRERSAEPVVRGPSCREPRTPGFEPG